MEYVAVAVVAALASGLTMYSGFGLGTILLPVFALFLPVDLAVAATAVVHAANNVLKTALLGKLADWGVVWRFGVPAVAAAFLGAGALSLLAGRAPLAEYAIFTLEAQITPITLALGLLMLVFAVFELHPRFTARQFDRRWLPLGGVLSGFFGGLSGHQGALRSAFLAKTRIDASSFVGTNAVIGLGVDLIRIAVYGWLVFGTRLGGIAGSSDGGLVVVGSLAAFVGVVVGRRYLEKVTMRMIRRLTGTLLVLIGLLLAAGLI